MPKSHQYCWKGVRYELGKVLSQYISFGYTSKLRSLSLSWNSINTNGLNSLIHSLAQNCRAVEFLDLNGNATTSDGIKCIRQAINTNGLNSFIHSLAQNCRALEFLDLKGNSITSDGIKCIKQAFKD